MSRKSSHLGAVDVTRQVEVVVVLLDLVEADHARVFRVALDPGA